MTHDTSELVERLIDRLPGIETPMMRGDNFAILLCSYFENPDQEVDDEDGWTPDATRGYEEVRAAIREHFAPAATALEQQSAEIARLREALGAVVTDGYSLEKAMMLARAALEKEPSQ